VKILIPDDRYGTHRQAHYHHDGVLRRTLEAGVSEVARIALSTMCYTYREELQHTKLRNFPATVRELTVPRFLFRPLWRGTPSWTPPRRWWPLSPQTWTPQEWSYMRPRRSSHSYASRKIC